MKEKNGCLIFDGYTLIKESLDVIPMDSKSVVNTISPNSYGLAVHDSDMMEALKGSDYLVLDGLYFGWWPLLRYGKRAHRITGWDCFVYYANRLNQSGGRMFFLGSTDGTLTKIKERMSKEYPNVVVDTFSPPFKATFSEEDNKAMQTVINTFNPDVLCVGMTAPKQEKWSYQNMPHLNTHISISIGNVFDWYAGNSRRPSLFWQKIGMEWLARIFMRPEIFRRNIGNQLLFFWHLLLRLLRIKK